MTETNPTKIEGILDLAIPGIPTADPGRLRSLRVLGYIEAYRPMRICTPCTSDAPPRCACDMHGLGQLFGVRSLFKAGLGVLIDAVWHERHVRRRARSWPSRVAQRSFHKHRLIAHELFHKAGCLSHFCKFAEILRDSSNPWKTSQDEYSGGRSREPACTRRRLHAVR